MKPACQISAEALRLGGEAVKPGVTTAQIDKIIYDYIVSQGARPNFKGLGGFPGSACISVNDVVIHGIPSHGTKAISSASTQAPPSMAGTATTPPRSRAAKFPKRRSA